MMRRFETVGEVLAAIDARIAENVGDRSPLALGMAAGLIEARFVVARLNVDADALAATELALAEAVQSEVRFASALDEARAEITELRAELERQRCLAWLRDGKTDRKEVNL
jgi:hypothetical protein